MVAVAAFFRILDKFSQTRNSSAPLIYKTLIFSLVESPMEPTIREMMLCNFVNLFEDNASIPLGLLIDPLFKLLLSNPQAIALKVFDFNFFVFIAKHPKLQSAQAAQLL